MSPAIGLYVHIPFCGVKCRFCHFATFPGLSKEIPVYLTALEREMKLVCGQRLDTIYVGGGSPSFLSELEIEEVLTSVRSHFEVETDAEISMECNPEDGSLQKLRSMKRSGVSRISFGLQASQDSLLKSLGRTHDFKKFLEAYDSARAAGFENVNVDLIFGLPGQALQDWEETIEHVLKIAPEHISGYALDVDEPSALSFQKNVPDDELQAEMYGLLSARLCEAGYLHYEISNFARPDFECRHNLKYWRNEACLGIGVSAAGYDRETRVKNKERMTSYLDDLRQGKRPIAEEIRLSTDERAGEVLMLGLRLKEGAALSSRTWNNYGVMLKKYSRLGLLEINAESNRAALNLRGWLLSNQIFRELISS